MKRSDPPQPAADDYSARLGAIRALAHQEDERRAAADLEFYDNFVTKPPIPLPRWLLGGKRKNRA